MSQRDSKKHTRMLLALAVAMFGFAFALVPLYDVFCEITGLNGKSSGQATLMQEIENRSPPVDREITIEFLAKVARGMPWEFRPVDNKLTVQAGVMNTTTFYVRNRARRSITGQAVPSVSPGLASQYLKKVECFCFEQQELPAGSEMEMPVSFYIDADLPNEINELTLSYTMFLVGDLDTEQVANHHN